MRNRILVGDCRETLRTLPDKSVHLCVTSPPYFGLRDYGGKREQIGQEATPFEFVDAMVDVFREVHRVLRDDGNLYLNLGDSYSVKSTYNAAQSLHTEHNWKQTGESRNTACYERTCGIPAKNLLMIPARVALALQADGWILREDIIWRKPNPMPESVRDRCTRSHEYLFHFTKQPKYYYDHEAIKTPPSEALLKQVAEGYNGQDTKQYAGTGAQSPSGTKARIIAKAREKIDKQRGHGRRHAGFNDRWDSMSRTEQLMLGANKRSVWDVATKPFKDAHFATYPPELIEPCILAASPRGGVVLDPFFGAGTTGLVAEQNGRSYIGCELNPEYVEIAQRRLNPPILTDHNPLLWFAVAA